MALNNDFQLDIATAHSRLSKKWKNKKWSWSELVAKCRETTRTGESMKEYLKMTREEQSDIKDVGGFVGGYLSGGTRKTANVMWRSVATLDIDYGTTDVWEDFTLQFGFAAMLYSTHKHTREKPRYRLVIPFSRPVKPAEYEPVCRKIAEAVGIDLFDITTYQLPRLFYWPSTSRDGEFVFEVQDGEACNPDDFLKAYVDYKDVSSWPVSSREGDVIAHEIRKAGDPLEKPGLTGFQGRFLYNGRIVWFYEQPVKTDAKHRYILYLDETLRHLEQSAVHDDEDIGNETATKLAKIAHRQLLCGTICIKTSLMEGDARFIYQTYKTREEIEQLFDTYKAEEDFNTTGMHSSETQEACLFLNHLSIMMAYRVYNVLRKNGALKKYAAVKTPEAYLWEVRVTNVGDGWQLEPIPKASRKALEALGLNPPEMIPAKEKSAGRMD